MNERVPSSIFSKAEAFCGKKPFLAAFLAALFLYAPILLLFKAYFQWDDDYYSVLLLKGIGLSWSPSEWNILENVLLCRALKSLYLHFSAIEWYGSLFVFTHFLSAWALLAAFNLGTNRLFKAVLFMLGSIVLRVRFHIQMEWTIVSATAAIGAFLLLAALWRQNARQFQKPALGLAFSLIILSILIRPYSILLISLASMPAAFYLSWQAEMTPFHRTILRFLAVTAALAGAVLAFHYYDYSRNPAWRDYEAVTGQYVGLSQFRNPVYDKTSKPLFDSLGWSVNDLDLFNHNYFMDTDTYSAEKLKKINSYFPQFDFDKKGYQDSFRAMFASPGFLSASTFFLASLPFLEGTSLGFILADAVWTAMVLCLFQWYFKMPERIFIPCLYLLNNLSVFFAVPKIRFFSKKLPSFSPASRFGTALMSLYLLFTAYILLSHYSAIRYWAAEETQLKVSVKNLNPQDDQVFVTWGSAFPFVKIGAFDDDEFLRHFHIISLDWFQRSPTTTAMMDHYGLKNVFNDLVDNPKAFLICDPHEWDLYRIYMKEKYNRIVNCKIDYQSGQFTVLSIHS